MSRLAAWLIQNAQAASISGGDSCLALDRPIRKQRPQHQRRARPGGRFARLALSRGQHKAVNTGSADSCGHSCATRPVMASPRTFHQDVCSPAPLWPPAYLQAAMIAIVCSKELWTRRGGSAYLRRHQWPPAKQKESHYTAADVPLVCTLSSGYHSESQKHSTHAAREDSVVGSLPSFFSVSMKSCWRPAGG